MKKTGKTKNIHIKVSEPELVAIKSRMEENNIKNLSQFTRIMLLHGKISEIENKVTFEQGIYF